MNLAWTVILCLAGDPAPWHLPDWQARAVVEVPAASADSGMGTAAVKVLCQGKAKPDGSDYRVVDSAGRSVPFAICFHDAARYSLIAFKAGGAGETFHVYYANPAAERPAEQVAIDAAPGTGPLPGDWTPKGLTLVTIERPQGPNPKTVEELAALIAGSQARYGGRFQKRISDGYNPFGPSDHYLSLYRGWITIPSGGTYKFCTASNEASFSFLDGKELIHWPGRHTAERGERGEKNVSLEVTAGPHYVEYYHEEVLLTQMAFLGWSPPGAPLGAFEGIPESAFPMPHEAAAVRYEGPAGPITAFEPVIVDSVWPETRHEGQYTRCRFKLAGAVSGDAAYHWDFGDGQTAEGAEVEHIYLAMGKYVVSVSPASAPTSPAASWPLDIYEIQHVTEEFGQGSSAEYAAAVKEYDKSKLDAASLKELAHLLAEGGDPASGLAVGKLFIERFASSEAQMAPRVRRLMADCALRLGDELLGDGGLDEAIANYRGSITDETPLAERLDVLARLIYLLGIERGLTDKSQEVLVEVEAAVKGVRLDEESQAAYRRALIAAGDALLWQKKLDEARGLYKRAEGLSKRIPTQVRSARIGAYPNAIREFLDSGDQGAALDLVRQWEESFPTEKLEGQTFFWRGKLLAIGGDYEDAARHLARSIGLGQGSAFESEARWLLAQSLESLGRMEDCQKELARLIASGADDEFAQKAREKLKKMTGSK